MDAFNFIMQLEGSLKAHVSLNKQEPDSWLMIVNLFYKGEPAGKTSFNLNGFSKSEAEDIARNLKSNDFLMREIDEYLWGESD